MTNDKHIRISEHPDYKTLVQKRSRYSWFMTSLMLVVYFGFIFLVAFKKDLLARPVSDGVMTISIPAGIGVILFTVIITGIYVRRANTEFDKLNEKIVKDSK